MTNQNPFIKTLQEGDEAIKKLSTPALVGREGDDEETCLKCGLSSLSSGREWREKFDTKYPESYFEQMQQSYLRDIRLFRSELRIFISQAISEARADERRKMIEEYNHKNEN